MERSPRQIAALLAIVEGGRRLRADRRRLPGRTAAFPARGFRRQAAFDRGVAGAPLADLRPRGARRPGADPGRRLLRRRGRRPRPSCPAASAATPRPTSSTPRARPASPMGGLSRSAGWCGWSSPTAPKVLELGPEQRIAQASNVSFDAATFEIWGRSCTAAAWWASSATPCCRPRSCAAFLLGKTISTDVADPSCFFQQYARQLPEVVASLDTLLFGGERCDPAAVRRSWSWGHNG